MKIYLAGPIAGGNPRADDLRNAAQHLQKLGHEIISPFVVDQEVNAKRFTDLGWEDLCNAITEDDLNRVDEADAVIAEISSPSHGVGVEVGYVTYMLRNGISDKPLLRLMHEDAKEINRSKLAQNTRYGELAFYTSHTLPRVLETFMSGIKVEGKITREPE